MKKQIKVETHAPKRSEFVGRLVINKSISINDKEFVLLKFDTVDGVKTVSSNTGQLSKFIVQGEVTFLEQLKDRFVKVIVEEHLKDATTYVKDGITLKHKSDFLNLLELIPIDDEAKGLYKAREAADVLGLTSEDRVNFVLRYLGKV